MATERETVIREIKRPGQDPKDTPGEVWPVVQKLGLKGSSKRSFGLDLAFGGEKTKWIMEKWLGSLE